MSFLLVQNIMVIWWFGIIVGISLLSTVIFISFYLFIFFNHVIIFFFYLWTGNLKSEEGMKVMFCPDFKVPLIVVKSDGGYTYDTSDIATIHQRLFDEKGTWLIYVTDAGQVRRFTSFILLFFFIITSLTLFF